MTARSPAASQLPSGFFHAPPVPGDIARVSPRPTRSPSRRRSRRRIARASTACRRSRRRSSIAVSPYGQFRQARLLGWHPTERRLLISTVFGNVSQIHEVRAPGGARTQLTFYRDGVTGAASVRSVGPLHCLPEGHLWRRRGDAALPLRPRFRLDHPPDRRPLAARRPRVVASRWSRRLYVDPAQWQGSRPVRHGPGCARVASAWSRRSMAAGTCSTGR